MSRWHEAYGDRRQQLVFIGIDMDEADIRRKLDAAEEKAAEPPEPASPTPEDLPDQQTVHALREMSEHLADVQQSFDLQRQDWEAERAELEARLAEAERAGAREAAFRVRWWNLSV